MSYRFYVAVYLKHSNISHRLNVTASPLMELPRGDEPSPGAAVPEVTGLPPGVVLRADNLEDVAPFEAYGCVLARNGGICVGIVVKKSPQKQLGERTSDWVFAFKTDKQVKKKCSILYICSFLSYFSYCSSVNFICTLATNTQPSSGAL